MYARISLYLLCGLCWASELLPSNVVLGLLLGSYLLTGGNYTLYLLYHTAGRDARGAWRYLQLLVLVYVYQKRNLTVSQVFQRTVRKHPDKVCMYFEDEKWTFRQVRMTQDKLHSNSNVVFCSLTSTATNWHTSSSRPASSTETAWLSSWRTDWSTLASGWAALRSGWCLLSSTSTYEGSP